MELKWVINIFALRLWTDLAFVILCKYIFSILLLPYFWKHHLFCSVFQFYSNFLCLSYILLHSHTHHRDGFPYTQTDDEKLRFVCCGEQRQAFALSCTDFNYAAAHKVDTMSGPLSIETSFYFFQNLKSTFFAKTAWCFQATQQCSIWHKLSSLIWVRPADQDIHTHTIWDGEHLSEQTENMLTLVQVLHSLDTLTLLLSIPPPFSFSLLPSISLPLSPTGCAVWDESSHSKNIFSISLTHTYTHSRRTQHGPMHYFE